MRPPPEASSVVDRLVIENGRRSIGRLLQALDGIGPVTIDFLGSFKIGEDEYNLPRCTLSGPNSSDPIRIGLFAALHGDEPAGALAAVQFLLDLANDPSPAENFLVRVYPLCNPTGFEDNARVNRRGRDLNREFWRGSTEAEVQILEHELRHQRFSGIIQLHEDDTSDGVYGFVRGHTLTENLLRPALAEASKILPRNANATIDGFAAREGIVYDHYEGVLAAPAEMERVPFEIILETPHHAPLDQQVQAMTAALRRILAEYRRLIAFAADI